MQDGTTPTANRIVLHVMRGVAVGQNRLSGRKVLVVDDNSPSRELLTLLFRAAGAEVTEAANGVEAVDKCGADDFDLVLMDVQMPVMDGLEATTAIRADESRSADRPQPLIVAVTAHAMGEAVRSCLAAGMDAVITKPIDPGTVVADVIRLLEER